MGELKNRKHEIFARNVIRKKGNLTEAYKDTYPESNHNSARANAPRLLRKDPLTPLRITELLNKANLSIPALNRKLAELANATKPVFNNETKRTEIADDSPIQLQATQTAYKLHGLLQPRAHSEGDKTINFNLSIAQLDKLDGIIDRVKALDVTEDTQTGEIE